MIVDCDLKMFIGILSARSEPEIQMLLNDNYQEEKHSVVCR